MRIGKRDDTQKGGRTDDLWQAAVNASGSFRSFLPKKERASGVVGWMSVKIDTGAKIRRQPKSPSGRMRHGARRLTSAYLKYPHPRKFPLVPTNAKLYDLVLGPSTYQILGQHGQVHYHPHSKMAWNQRIAPSRHFTRRVVAYAEQKRLKQTS